MAMKIRQQQKEICRLKNEIIDEGFSLKLQIYEQQKEIERLRLFLKETLPVFKAKHNHTRGQEIEQALEG